METYNAIIEWAKPRNKKGYWEHIYRLTREEYRDLSDLLILWGYRLELCGGILKTPYGYVELW